MTYDAHKNFGFTVVALAPSTPTAGTTFSVLNANAVNLPDPASVGAYNLTVTAANQQPLSTNSEIIRITAKGAADSGGAGFTQFTISRLAENNAGGTMTARSIQVGDWISHSITAKTLTDVETNKLDRDGSQAMTGTLTFASLTTTQQNALTPVNGMTHYNSTKALFQKYENSQWVDISKSPATVVIAPSGSGFSADYYTPGTADDVVIQNAINSISKGIVLCKIGDYQITAKLKIPTDVYLYGEGLKTRFIATSALAEHMIINKNLTDSNIQIRDIYLDCTATTTGNGTVIQLAGVTDGLIQDVETNGGIGAGIVITGCTRTYVVKTHAHNSTWSGIWIQQNNVNCGVDQCVTNANGGVNQGSGHGIEIGNLTNNNNSFIRISNNISHNNQNGIRWYGFGQHHIDIIGNICYNNGEAYPTLDGNGIGESSGATPGTVACYDINIIGNICYNNSVCGVSLATSSSGVPAAYGYNISGNICTYNRANGIFLTNLIDSIVDGNNCHDNYANGLVISSSCQNITGSNHCNNNNTVVAFSGTESNGTYVDGNAAHSILQNRNATTGGQNLTIQAGGALSGGTNLAGGTLKVSGGIATGNGRSDIQFYGASPGSSGTSDVTPTLLMTLFGNGRLFLGSDTNPSGQVDGITMNANIARSIVMNRHTTSNTAGNNFTIQSGGATSSATDKAAGNLILTTGIATGTGGGSILFKTPTPQGSTNTTDNSAVTRMTISSAGIDVSSLKITSLLDPTGAQDAATKNYVDAVAQGLSVKPSAIVATTTTLPTYTYLSGVITMTATGVVSIDGHNLALNDVVLIKDETSTNQPNNGLYTVTTAGAVGVALVLTRHTSMDASTEFSGGFVFIESGTINVSAGFVCTNTGSVTVGTTNISFTQFSGAGEITAGNSLTKIGNTLDTIQDIRTSASPVFAGLSTSGLTVTGQIIASGNASSILSVGLNGSTNPAFNVDSSIALSVTGFNVKSGISGGGLAASVISSAANENLTIDAKGSGTISLGSVSTGNIIISTLQLTNALGVGYGGTGQTSYTDGQLLIGNTTGNTLAKATLTAGNNVTVTNGHGSITLDTIQNIRTTDSPTFAGLSLGSGSLNTVGNIEIDGTAARDITVGQSATTTGRSLTIQAGQSVTGGTNESGGSLNLVAGAGTGNNGNSNIIFRTGTAVASGTTTQSISEKGRFTNSSNGRFVIGDASGGISGGADGLILMGTVARSIIVVRNTTAATGGQNLTIQAGGATSTTTDKSGGNLLLLPGISTGTGRSYVSIQGLNPAVSTGTGDNSTFLDRTIIGGFKTLTNNSAINLVNFTLASNTVISAVVRYAIEVFDGTNLQLETGEIMVQCANKGGVFSGNTVTQIANDGTTLGKPKQILTAGTLGTAAACVWAITGANPAVLSVNANSSLTPSTGYPRITYTLENYTQQSVSIL